MKKALLLAAVISCTPCIDWTRFTGTVRRVDPRNSTITIQLKGGDLLMIPIDYQVTIQEKGDERRRLKDLQLGEKITLTRVSADAPAPEDTTGMAQPERK